MNKAFAFSTLLAATSLCLASSMAAATPVTTEADFTCPIANSAVFNFGSYIGGSGTETILSQTSPIYFQSSYSPWGVPNDLRNYSNSNATYDSAWGAAICSYESSNPDDESFELYYPIINGTGGIILAQTSSTVNVLLPIGLHA